MAWILWLMTSDPLLILAPGPPILALVLMRRQVRKAWREGSRLPGAWPETEGAQLLRCMLRELDAPEPAIPIVDQAPTDRIDPGAGAVRISPRVARGADQAAQGIALLIAGEWLAARDARWFRALRGLLTAWLPLAALLTWALLATGLFYRWNTMYGLGAACLWGLAGAAGAGFALDWYGWNQFRLRLNERPEFEPRFRAIAPVCRGFLGRDAACCLGPMRRVSPNPTLNPHAPAR
jgi:Zn-dependent membrane protease YugP